MEVCKHHDDPTADGTDANANDTEYIDKILGGDIEKDWRRESP